jgi:hypothetical protein
MPEIPATQEAEIGEYQFSRPAQAEKLVKPCLKSIKRLEWEEGGLIKNHRKLNLIQVTLFACMKLSQQNPLIQLIYGSEKEEIGGHGSQCP